MGNEGRRKLSGEFEKIISRHLNMKTSEPASAFPLDYQIWNPFGTSGRLLQRGKLTMNEIGE